jgi:DNA-binding transcriptional regulator/RsmH inhibitor MraZ
VGRTNSYWEHGLCERHREAEAALDNEWRIFRRWVRDRLRTSAEVGSVSAALRALQREFLKVLVEVAVDNAVRVAVECACRARLVDGS